MVDRSVKTLIGNELDRAYAKTAGLMLAQIAILTRGTNSPMQTSLKKLDDEANRLDESDERMAVDNAQLEQTLGVYRDTLETTETLILANDNAIEESGVLVAIPAVTAKVFMAETAALIDAGTNPITTNAVQSAVANTPWIIPQADEIATNFILTEAWQTRMNTWGDGYADLGERTIVNGIQQGWGPKRTASQIRQWAENIPVSAAENLTRTLQITSYRDASAAMELVNGQFIERKIRVATLDGNTCLACIDLHGTPLAPGESPDDHYSGRCDSFYVVIGGPRQPEFMQADSLPGQRNFVPYQNGPDWFNSLSPERQAQQASFLSTPAKLRAFESGTPLSAFVSPHVDDVFGGQIVEDSLIGALGSDAEQFYSVNQ